MEEIEVLSEDSPRITEIKSGSDFEFLKTELCSLKRSLKEQRVTCNNLREERDEAVALNRQLKRQVEELRKEVYRGKTCSSTEVRDREKNKNYDKGPLEDDESLISFFLALPRKIVRGLVNRAALFVWWTGAWANEGLGLLQIENKWVELQRLKYELEEDNSRLENEVVELQDMMAEKDVEMVRQVERNKDLTRKLNTKQCTMSGEMNSTLDKMTRHIHTVAAFSDSLSEEIERLKATMVRRLAQFERIHQDIGRLTEGQRLLEIAENNLERKVENLADARAHDCHSSSAEYLQAQADLPNNVESEKPEVSSDGGNSESKAPECKRSRVCGIFCYGFRIIFVFLLTFLVTGVIFHFILLGGAVKADICSCRSVLPNGNPSFLVV